jgi:hypothetical protein
MIISGGSLFGFFLGKLHLIATPKLYTYPKIFFGLAGHGAMAPSDWRLEKAGGIRDRPSARDKQYFYGIIPALG